MTDEERMKLVKNTLAYAIYDLRIALCELAVAITESFGKSNRITNVLQSNKADIQRMQGEYIAEIMND